MSHVPKYALDIAAVFGIVGGLMVLWPVLQRRGR